GAAQGILSFSKAASSNPEYLEVAKNILGWTLNHLQGPRGNFYYQKRRLFTWKIDLMRWSNSWMWWALHEYQKALGLSLRNTQTIESHHASQISPSTAVEGHL